MPDYYDQFYARVYDTMIPVKRYIKYEGELITAEQIPPPERPAMFPAIDLYPSPELYPGIE